MENIKHLLIGLILVLGIGYSTYLWVVGAVELMRTENSRAIVLDYLPNGGLLGVTASSDTLELDRSNWSRDYVIGDSINIKYEYGNWSY